MARTSTVATRVLGRMAGAAVMATLVTGCGMSSITSGIGGGMFGGGNASKTADKAVTHEQMLSAAKANAPMSVGGDVAGGCPRFSVWPRDHHVTVYEQGRIGDGLAVLHRGEITQTARECQIQGTRVTVKYGFSGRVLLGPKGHPGTVSLPVNIFVTDAKRARVTTEQGKVDVLVSAEKPVGYFSSVHTVSFDVPVGSRPGEFEVFVGFDQKTPGAG
ncbi:MAG: hypothetical protein AB7L90_21340 [Hyphomicrobiaceae bacterium]